MKPSHEIRVKLGVLIYIYIYAKYIKKVTCICYAQRSKKLIEQKKRPQRVVALEKQPQRIVVLEKQPQREISCCGCF